MGDDEFKLRFTIIAGYKPANENHPFEDITQKVLAKIKEAKNRQERYIAVFYGNNNIISGSKSCLKTVWKALERLSVYHDYKLVLALDLSQPWEEIEAKIKDKNWYQLAERPVNTLPPNPPLLRLPPPQRNSATILPFKKT